MSATAETLQAAFKRDVHVISLVSIAHGLSHFFHLLIPSLFPWLKLEFALSHSELALLMTAFFVVSSIGQALAGFVVDRIGAYPVLMSGIVFFVIAALTLGAAQNYSMLLLGAGIAGLGNSVFHPADYTLLGKRVSNARIAHAFSMHGLSGFIGWGLAPVFAATFSMTVGWRFATLAAAAICVAVVALLAVYKSVLSTPSESAKPKTTAAHATEHVLAFLRLRSVWLCFGFFLISAMSLGGVQSFVPAALHDVYGLTKEVAASMITVFMIGSAGGLLVGGTLAAKSTHHDRIVAGALLIAASMSFLIATTALPNLLVFVAITIMGVGQGIAGPSRDLLVRAAAPRNATGRVFGTVYAGLDVGLAIAPIMFGAMMDFHHPAWVFVGVGIFQAAALSMALGVGQSAAHREQVA